MTDATRSTGPTGPSGSPGQTGSIRARTLALLGAGLLAAVALAGCSGGDGSGGDGSGSAEQAEGSEGAGDTGPSGEAEGRTSSSEVDTTISDEEQAVIDAYLAELDAFYAAANPPNPDHPALEQTATGELLERLRERLAERRDEGLGVRRGDRTRFDIAVTEIEGRTARAVACVVDADIEFRLDTGEVVDDSVIFSRFRSELTRIDGTWKVAKTTVKPLDRPCDV